MPSRLIQLALDDHDQAKLTRKRDHTRITSGLQRSFSRGRQEEEDKRALAKD
jgi:hypothetical protein